MYSLMSLIKFVCRTMWSLLVGGCGRTGLSIVVVLLGPGVEAFDLRAVPCSHFARLVSWTAHVAALHYAAPAPSPVAAAAAALRSRLNGIACNGNHCLWIHCLISECS